METMERKKGRPRRSFTPEFKAEIVELCRRGDRTVGQVARDFDLTETAVRAWVHQAETDAGERPGLTSEEREELFRRRCCVAGSEGASKSRPLDVYRALLRWTQIGHVGGCHERCARVRIDQDGPLRASQTAHLTLRSGAEGGVLAQCNSAVHRWIEVQLCGSGRLPWRGRR